MSDTNLNDASFTPEIQDSEESTNKQTYSATGSFRFWCQKVLPLVYDDSLSYYELLCKVVNYLNNVIQNVDNLNTSVDNTNTAFNNLQSYVNATKDTLVEVYGELEQYVNDYFNNLDVQEEINSKLDSMAEDGSLSTIISPFIPSAVSDWLSNNITPTSPAIDASLSISGAGADAKVTGDTFAEIRQISTRDNNLFNLTTWSQKRVDESGSLVNSLSQLTNDTILYVGKNNKVKISNYTANSISIIYYQFYNKTFNYKGSSLKPNEFIADYDYIRISFVGTSTSLPNIENASISVTETDTTLTRENVSADAKATGDAFIKISADITQAITNELDPRTFTTWSNKRVTDTGDLTYSPSQLTTNDIIYIGKYNILKAVTNVATRSISISYYQKDTSGTFTYVRSVITAIRYIRYFCAEYDYIRISFVGTASAPPTIDDFTLSFIKNKNAEFFNKKFAILGDSISTFKGVSEKSDTLNAAYYPTSDVEYYEQTYAKMFFDACGGSTISVSAISNSSWRDQGMTNCPSAYETSRIERLSLNGVPDFIIINMGTNDPYSSNIGDGIDYTFDVETLEENVVYSSYAIQATIRKIQTTYPNAKIILLIPKFASAIGSGLYTFEKWEKLMNYIIDIGNMYGVYKIVDLRKCGITKETFSVDCVGGGMHPNYTGMQKMGEYLIKELLIK